MEDYIECKICGFKSKRIYGRHLKSHGITSEEYIQLYPESPLYSDSDCKKTSIKSGKHMKTEKYKKIFSEKIKGEKNPQHKSKTTLKHRQSCSPFSKEFKNYNNDNERDIFIKNVCDNKTYTTRLDYWLDKGFSQKESEKKLKERQTTFTLDICIEKNGKEKGKQIYTNRQLNWQISLYKNGNLKAGYSKISQELFFRILENYDHENTKNVHFATKNDEFRLEKEEGGVWIYDYVDLKNKKIIEYNGDLYHANPKIYNSSEHPHPFIKHLTAQDIWNKDERKRMVAEEEGFEVLTIWDSDYKKHKDEIVEKCLEFLKIKNGTMF